MKLHQLFEMPMLTNRELGSDPDDDIEPMKPFVITVERYKERYEQLAQKGDAVVAISKDHKSAIVATRTTRHDNADAYSVLGILELKENPNLGFPVDSHYVQKNKILQVTLVTVAEEAKFMGVGSFLYSSIAQAGFTIISDTHQFKGGQALWKKLARSKLANEVVYVMNQGKVFAKNNQPVIYDGSNIPDNEIWSEDQQHKYVLLIYKKK